MLGDYRRFSGTDSNILLIRTDADGNELWRTRPGGDSPSMGSEVRETADGGYVLFGDTMHSDIDNSADYLLVKTDGAGNLSWTKTWGSAGDDWSGGVVEVAGGGFVVSGARRSENITSELQE